MNESMLNSLMRLFAIMELSASLGNIKEALSSISLTTPYPYPERIVMNQFSETTGIEAIKSGVEKFGNLKRKRSSGA